jgi:hypothetical protein
MLGHEKGACSKLGGDNEKALSRQWEWDKEERSLPKSEDYVIRRSRDLRPSSATGYKGRAEVYVVLELNRARISTKKPEHINRFHIV